MCIGDPLQILSVDGIAARATDGKTEHLIDISLIGPVAPGDWVLCFLGAARAVLSPDEAAKIQAAVEALRAVMTGGDLGDAFADLDARAPTLPPHLLAAQAAGKTSA